MPNIKHSPFFLLFADHFFGEDVWCLVTGEQVNSATDHLITLTLISLLQLIGLNEDILLDCVIVSFFICSRIVLLCSR